MPTLVVRAWPRVSYGVCQRRPRPKDDSMTSLVPAVTAEGRPVGSPWAFAEAARYLCISLRHLIRLADAGKVQTIRFGRRRLISDAEVRRIAAEGCRA